MSSFRLTPEARLDLKNIGRHTQERWGSVQRNKYLTQLDERLHWLAGNKKLGRKRDEIKKGYLSFLEGKHIIFYRIKNSDIEILGILHQNMDVTHHLPDEQ